MKTKNNRKHFITVPVALSLILWLVCFLSLGWGQYVGLNYSEEKVCLKNITKDSLKTIFNNKDSTKVIELKQTWEDSSYRVIYINPAKKTFHSFWYPICTEPNAKLIVNGRPHKPILLLHHEIRVVRKDKKSN